MSHTLSFHHLALFASSLFLVLGAIWMLSPSRLLSAWGLANSASIAFLGSRLSALYTGIAIMLYFGRNAPPSLMRDAFIYGLVTTCLMLAFSGIYAFMRGTATKGIFGAVLIEIVLSLLCLSAT